MSSSAEKCGPTHDGVWQSTLPGVILLGNHRRWGAPTVPDSLGFQWLFGVCVSDGDRNGEGHV